MSDKKKPPVTMVRIDKISFELSKQARLQDDDSKVDEYAAAIDAGEELPPPDLYREMLPGPEKDYFLLIGDGWKRIRAHLKLGLAYINARIWEEGRAGAIKHACRANTSKQHGVVRTQADARNAIQIYLLESDWHLDSDPLIAKYCEVDHKTVATVRERLEKEGKIPVTIERRGADGKMYPAKQDKKQGGNSHPEVQPSLLIKTPVQSSQGVTATFDEGERRQEEIKKATPADTTLPPQNSPSIEYVKYGEGEAVPPKKEEASDLIAQSVEASFEKSGELDAKTLLPKKNGGVESSTPPKKVKLAKVKCPVCKGELRAPDHCGFCSDRGWLEVELIRDQANVNGESYQHYCSPPVLIEATKLIAKIGADFCYNEFSKWDARINVDETQDSLSFLYPWADMLRDDEIAPLNPPWNNMEPFVDKLLKEVIRGKQWLLIGPGGSTAAVWYQRSAKSCALRIEPDKRLKYYKEGVEDPNPRDATALFYWGHQVAKVAAIFSRLGWLVTKRVDPADYAEAAELLRKEALDKRQQGLPFLANPEDKPKEAAKCPSCGEPSSEQGNLCDACDAKIAKPPMTHFCGACATLIDLSQKYCDKHKPAEVRDVKPEKVQLHQALKAVGAQYQKEGYEVSVVNAYAPRKKFSVMGTIAKISDREVYQQDTVKDTTEDAYTIDFINIESDGAPICTLRAVKIKTAEPANVPDVPTTPHAEKEAALPFVCMHSACKERRRYDSSRAFWKHQKESHDLTRDLCSLAVVHVGDKSWMSIQDTYDKESILGFFNIDPRCQCVWGFDANGIHQRPYTRHTITLQKGHNYLMGSSRALIGSFSYECHRCKEVFLGDDCELISIENELWPVCEDCRKAKPEEARSPRASRAYAQLKACLTWEEFDTTYTKLEALATTLEERNTLLEYRSELRGSLPSQHNVKPEHLQKKEEKAPEAAKPCPTCHCEPSVSPAMRKAKVGKKWVSCPVCVKAAPKSAPTPQRIKGKDETPIKSPLKKNNPGAHLAQKARGK